MHPLSQEHIHWLRLARSQDIGPKTFHRMIETFRSATKAIAIMPEMMRRGGGQTSFVPASEASVFQECEKLERLGGRFLFSCDDDFPLQLKDLVDYPPVLSVIGRVELLKHSVLGIVGSRDASANGCMLAKTFAASLGKQGLVIASGLARGVDTAAHRGSLETGTIAVVAGGLDIIYPPENAKLAMEIQQSGMMIAEMPIGTPPRHNLFPRRNRIIAGCSLGVLVVEGGVRSGSLITAKMALDLGRDIFAIPGFPLDPRCMGPNALIKQGAILVEAPDDVIQALALPMMARVDHSVHTAMPELPLKDDDIQHGRTRLHKALSATEITVDALITETAIPHAVMMYLLLELELAGKLLRPTQHTVVLKV